MLIVEALEEVLYDIEKVHGAAVELRGATHLRRRLVLGPAAMPAAASTASKGASLPFTSSYITMNRAHRQYVRTRQRQRRAPFGVTHTGPAVQ
jgi:hypothetical protein